MVSHLRENNHQAQETLIRDNEELEVNIKTTFFLLNSSLPKLLSACLAATKSSSTTYNPSGDFVSTKLYMVRSQTV